MTYAVLLTEGNVQYRYRAACLLQDREPPAVALFRGQQETVPALEQRSDWAALDAGICVCIDGAKI